MRLLVVVLVASVSVTSCGTRSDTPVSVTPVSSPLTLTLSPPTDVMFIGRSAALTATATFQDGSARAVQATWGTDAPGIATVAADGAVTGVRSGDVTIFADYQGLRATQRLRVVPNYDGDWSASYQTTSCTETGDWNVGGCEPIDLTTAWRIYVELRQDRTSMTGQLTPYSDLPAVPVTGTVADDGHFTASGSVPYTLPNCIPSCLLEILDLDVLSTDNATLTGHFTMRASTPALQGFRSWTNNLVGSKQAGGILAVRRPGAGGLDARPAILIGLGSPPARR